MKRQNTFASNPEGSSSEFVPDVEREDREWNRLSCTCGGMLGMSMGHLLRIRHRDRNHTPDTAVYVYIDLSGVAPQVIAEVSAKAGTGKEHYHG